MVRDLVQDRQANGLDLVQDRLANGLGSGAGLDCKLSRIWFRIRWQMVRGSGVGSDSKWFGIWCRIGWQMVRDLVQDLIAKGLVWLLYRLTDDWKENWPLR